MGQQSDGLNAQNQISSLGDLSPEEHEYVRSLIASGLSMARVGIFLRRRRAKLRNANKFRFVSPPALTASIEGVAPEGVDEFAAESTSLSRRIERVEKLVKEMPVPGAFVEELTDADGGKFTFLFGKMGSDWGLYVREQGSVKALSRATVLEKLAVVPVLPKLVAFLKEREARRVDEIRRANAALDDLLKREGE